MWIDNTTNFKASNSSPKTTVGTTTESVFCCLRAGSAIFLPHQQNVSMWNSLSMTVTFWSSQFQIKSLGCASYEVTCPTGSLWHCKSPSFLSKQEERRCTSQSHVTEAHPKPTKIQFMQKRAHEKESHVLFLEWLFKLAHAADRKWRMYLFRED